VHGIFEREGLVNRRSVFRGYGAFLKFILGADAREPA
jgi:hypothetical protein